MYNLGMDEPKKLLKLFIVGETSGNPDDWDDYTSFSLVYAHDEDEARSLVGDDIDERHVAAVLFPEVPGVIYTHSAVNGGWLYSSGDDD